MSSIPVDFHIIVGQRFTNYGHRDGRPSVRVSKNKPACDKHEVAIALHLELPEALFKRPSLNASVVVPEASAPLKITPSVMSNIASVIQEQLGITLNITAPVTEES